MPGGTVDGVEILHVLHASSMAAIPTAAGPRRLIESGLEERLSGSGLNVQVTDVPVPDADSPGPVAEAFAVAASVARHVRAALGEDRLAIVLSGSCHTAIGSVAGLPKGRRGVVWFDAHGDFNTPDTTPSGLLDGTTLATITGRCWARLADSIEGFVPVPDDSIVLAGVRKLDPGEAALLNASSIGRLSLERIRPATGLLRELGRQVDAVYTHLDLDVLDPAVGAANAFAVAGGPSSEELQALMRAVRRSCPVRVVGLASYDPEHDSRGTVSEAALDAVEALLTGA